MRKVSTRMKDTPRVSVIIPTYNRAQLLPRAIDSVLQQTYKNIETIIIDDGSTDNTKQVITPYAPYIRYLPSNHQGVANARNLGMKAATGKYIAFLDSDDMYLPHKLELQVDFIETHPSVGMVCTEFSGQFADGRFVERLMHHYHPVWNKRNWTYDKVFSQSGTFRAGAHTVLFYIGDIFTYILQDTLIPTNTMLLRKDLLDVVGYQNVAYRFAQEYEFAVRICKHSSIAFLDIPTYVLFVHDQQSTASLTAGRLSGKKDSLLAIQAWEVFLNTVTDWGLKDQHFYKQHRRLVDDRLSEIHYMLGKRWLACGDNAQAREHFSHSVTFRSRYFSAWFYRLLLSMPDTLTQAISHILRTAHLLRAG